MISPQPQSLPSLIHFKQPTEAIPIYHNIRKTTEEICHPLSPEDFIIQSMEDVSPPKWHLAHTSWFFETFILKKAVKNYPIYHPQYDYLFNSYYKGVGAHQPRRLRGLLSRPTIEEIRQYRRHVDEWMTKLLEAGNQWEIFHPIVELGLHHEQQHQELLLTDIKHIFFSNPSRPAYRKRKAYQPKALPPPGWIDFPEGLIQIGKTKDGFSFDNERPRHRVFLESYRLGSRLITNGEYIEFMESGGYSQPLLWLSDGWDWLQKDGCEAPLYWEKRGNQWWNFTLSGMRPVISEAPVCHLNYYEADAYARWQQKRLPTEAEWENAAQPFNESEGHFFDPAVLEPQPANSEKPKILQQMFGDVWEWTQSPYSPYPRFKPTTGELGEYNGKFMCNQMVLRGGSCFSPRGHLRSTYRNFFLPQSRWQCTGLRLADDPL